MTSIRRARPLLGTIVTIEIVGPGSREALLRAADRGFEAVERVHALMSPIERGSDVARLRRARPGQIVTVHPWTVSVLRAARRYWQDSGGAFDPAAGGRGSLADLTLGPGRRVRVRGRVELDLGGIAKGSAVDRAIARLRRTPGVRAACVNAGGDLRVFGRAPIVVDVRHPRSPGRIAARVRLSNGALATSGPAFGPGPLRGLYDPFRNRPYRGSASATAAARTCLAADALSKVALFAPPAKAVALVRRRGGRAFLVDGDRITTLA